MNKEIYKTLKDTIGRPRTQSLFYEMRNPDYTSPYTLKDYDHEGRLSMYKLYLEIGDPTEYEFAQQVLGSWTHWEKLSSCEWFKPYLTRWRRELKTKMESQRFQEMLDIVEKNPNSPQGIQATKWLAERYGEKKQVKRGRPSKEEKAQLLAEESEADKILAEDAERLGL